MPRALVSDALWDRVEPYLPKERPKPQGGRPRVPARRCLTGILFVLRTGCPWNAIPVELDAASGPTCWRRLQEWEAAGAWDAIWRHVLGELRRRGRLRLEVAVVDSLSMRAVKGGATPGPTPPIAASAASSAI